MFCNCPMRLFYDFIGVDTKCYPYCQNTVILDGYLRAVYYIGIKPKRLITKKLLPIEIKEAV